MTLHLSYINFTNTGHLDLSGTGVVASGDGNVDPAHETVDMDWKTTKVEGSYTTHGL